MLDRKQVYEAIEGERGYQDRKWGPARYHEVAAFILYMEHHLEIARKFASIETDDKKALEEIRKVTALGVVAMEFHGAPRREN